MVLPGHLSGGYLATTALLSLVPWSFSANELTALYIIGTVAGEIPDIDLFRFYFEKKYNQNSPNQIHRDYFTHIPLFWIIISLLICIFGLFLNSNFTIALGFVFLVGTISHFILDSIDYGINWLKPFSSKRFYIFPMKLPPENSTHIATGSIPYYWNYLKGAYLKQATFYAEVLITIIAIFVLLN